eukprot:1347477-Amphidinium_carterae.1
MVMTKETSCACGCSESKFASRCLVAGRVWTIPVQSEHLDQSLHAHAVQTVKFPWSGQEKSARHDSRVESLRCHRESMGPK